MTEKYIFLDIDGTLYSPEINDTPASARKAIHEARANGAKVFLCTGRSLAECAKYLGYQVDGFIFGAGSMIYAERKRIYDHPIRREDVLAIKEQIHAHGMGYSCEGIAGAYCDEYGYECVLIYFSGGEKSREKQIEHAMENGFYPEIYQHEDDGIYKICCYTNDDEDFERLEKDLPKPYILTITMRDPRTRNHIAEITDANINKSTGIRRVLDFYHADWKDSVAIGDSGNDISMIRDCGLGIAMGNAFPQVKEAADWVTSDILEDGIYNAFLHIGVISGKE